MLEQGTVDLLRELGVSARMDAEAIEHGGIHLQFAGDRHHVPMRELTGRGITIWGQTEVVKDLSSPRIEAGLPLPLASRTSPCTTSRPSGRASAARRRRPRARCDAIAGCDGSRQCPPPRYAGAARVLARVSAGWLGILAAVEPSIDRLVYAHHARGFALPLRSPTLSRYYVQVAHDEDVANWPDERIWEELQARTALEGWTLRDGPILEKGVTGMRLRRRADAARPAVPRRRRVAHRAADRRQG